MVIPSDSSFTYEMAAIPGHLIGPRQRKNISSQFGHERRGARPSSTPPSCSSAYGAGRVPDPAPLRRRPHPPPAPQPLSWLERGRRSPRLVGGPLRTGHRRHHGTTHPHRPTAQQARQIQQDPGPPRSPPPHHVVPAGIRTSSSTSGVGDRRKRPRRVSGENFAHETHR